MSQSNRTFGTSMPPLASTPTSPARPSNVSKSHATFHLNACAPPLASTPTSPARPSNKSKSHAT
ncbi:MAG: hypothetical protein K8963_00590, partial [Proteobacteria bacterium]|nr:hypothetical protein [Pseudomonadota bacterium]